MAAKLIDLTGQKFGRLTVIKRAENKGKRVAWLCKCECGNEIVIIGSNLKNGSTKSCGCYKKEMYDSEEFKKIHSDKMKELWKDEDFRKMQSNQMKELSEELWKDEEFRKMQSEKSSERMKEQWQDEEMKWKMGYKGGITPISMYLRDMQIVKQWRKDTYIRENSKCQLTGNHVHGGNSDVHHLKAFNTIVQEAHDLHKIKIKEIVADYTEQELQLLEDYIIKQHENTDNAVLLCDELHMLFHRPKKDGGYGKGNNTLEQFEEFKERYLAGEFKEILK